MTQLTSKQEKQFRADYIDQDGQPCVLIATIRYDDRCGNGHNTFAITGDLYDTSTVVRSEPSIVHKNGKRLWLGSCGCIHDDISERLPELAKYIKWHLVSTDGPMHYIANSMYHAKEIPREQGKYYAYLKEPITGVEKLLNIVTEQTKALLDAQYGDLMRYEPCYNTSAKEPNLEYARLTAVWPEAELEDFTEEKLKARLPDLMVEFRDAVEELGFTY